MVFNAISNTISAISWQLVLLLAEIEGLGELLFLILDLKLFNDDINGKLKHKKKEKNRRLRKYVYSQDKSDTLLPLQMFKYPAKCHIRFFRTGIVYCVLL